MYTTFCIVRLDTDSLQLQYWDKNKLSQWMRFPTMWYVQPAKAQTSLHIRTAWSEPLLVAWIYYESTAADWTPFGVSKLKMRLHRLIWVYTCQNTKLLEFTRHGSNLIEFDQMYGNHTLQYYLWHDMKEPENTNGHTKFVSLTRESHNHTPQTNFCHWEDLKKKINIQKITFPLRWLQN